jgi:hypothetical protein
VKEDELGMTCDIHGAIRNIFKFFLRKQQERGRRRSEVVGGSII